MRYVFFVFVCFFSFVFVSYAYDLSLATIETEQAQKVATTGFYEQKVRGAVDPNIEVWVYQTPDKSVGYQIIEHAPDDSWINSTGYGPEAKERTFLKNEKDNILNNSI